MDDQKRTTQMSFTPAQLQAIREPHLLRQIQGPGSPCVYPLVVDSVVIGRDESADISVKSDQVSRAHLKIERNGQEFTCVDLESSNGTYLDGLKISSVVLRDRDTLQLGDCVFEYRAGST